MKRKLITKNLLAVGVASALVGFSGNASAGAFQLFEQNAVNMGDFGAGGAAIADDASTAYYNPAGLVRIPNQQLVLSGDEVITTMRFSGTNIWASTSPLVPPGFTFSQSGTAQGGAASFIPALHYAAPLTDSLVFGFSVAPPFGLETDYGQGTVLRYSATETNLETIDLSPSLGYKISNKFSVGAGFDAEYLRTDFDSVAGLPLDPTNPTQFDTESKNEGSDWGYGWHAGILYQFDPCTRVGIAYRSAVHFNNIEGTSKLVGPLAGLPAFFQTGVITSATLKSNDLQSSVTLPPTITLSGYHDINSQWAVDGSINYTEWNQFNKSLILHNVQSMGLDPNTGLPVPTFIDVNVPQNFHNTWRFAAGVIYKPTEKLALRAGGGIDQSPVNGTDRNVRLPDNERYAIAVGAHYQVLKPLGVDVGWTHLFMPDTSVNVTTVAGTQVSTAVGTYSNHADLLGAQLTWDIT